VSYFLDTDSCIAILRPKPSLVRTRAERAIARDGVLRISSVVVHELWYGANKSQRVEENRLRLQDFLSAYVEVCAFDAGDAQVAGEIRAELEKEGKRIGALDTLIAGQCLRADSVLVTSNTAEFIRVKGLRVEDWVK